MGTVENKKDQIMNIPESSRRIFIRKGLALGTLAAVTGLSLVTSCKSDSEEDISPAEDLMREHGVLNRILLIYDTCRLHLENNTKFPLESLNDAAQIIRSFIEEYHEKLEENFLFPRFETAQTLTDLVTVLRAQHKAGRTITDQIIYFSNMKIMQDEDAARLKNLMTGFNRMYRPHEAREDTVLFPAIRKIISRNEYFSLGEDFEKKEHELFGEDGFENMVEKVANIEKSLDIYELSEFTPDITS